MRAHRAHRNAGVEENIAAQAARDEQPMYRPPTWGPQWFSVSKCSLGFCCIVFYDVYYVNK